MLWNDSDYAKEFTHFHENHVTNFDNFVNLLYYDIGGTLKTFNYLELNTPKFVSRPTVSTKRKTQM